MKKISQFTGEYRFLSNFWPSPVEFEGRTYPTVEHAYVAAKSFDERFRATISNVTKPGAVKRLGREVDLRPDWDEVKLEIMVGLIQQKFKPFTKMGDRLLQTFPLPLEEGNTWRDRFWGVCPPNSGKGQNHLGKILMVHRLYLLSCRKKNENLS